MPSSHALDRIAVRFDDDDAVASAGLLAVATLLGRVGLEKATDAARSASAEAPGPSSRASARPGDERTGTVRDRDHRFHPGDFPTSRMFRLQPRRLPHARAETVAMREQANGPDRT